MTACPNCQSADLDTTGYRATGFQVVCKSCGMRGPLGGRNKNRSDGHAVAWKFWIDIPRKQAEIPRPPKQTMEEGVAALESWVFNHKEEISIAFLAKYGCEPRDVEMVSQETKEGTTWSLRRRTSPSPEEKLRIILHALQVNLQPAGSPCPGDDLSLALWIIREAREGVLPAHPGPKSNYAFYTGFQSAWGICKDDDTASDETINKAWKDWGERVMRGQGLDRSDIQDPFMELREAVERFLAARDGLETIPDGEAGDEEIGRRAELASGLHEEVDTAVEDMRAALEVSRKKETVG